MIDGKRIAIVMPAYNAERTLEKTVRGLPGIVDIKMDQLRRGGAGEPLAAPHPHVGCPIFRHVEQAGEIADEDRGRQGEPHGEVAHKRPAFQPGHAAPRRAKPSGEAREGLYPPLERGGKKYGQAGRPI